MCTSEHPARERQRGAPELRDAELGQVLFGLVLMSCGLIMTFKLDAYTLYTEYRPFWNIAFPSTWGLVFSTAGGLYVFTLALSEAGQGDCAERSFGFGAIAARVSLPTVLLARAAAGLYCLGCWLLLALLLVEGAGWPDRGQLYVPALAFFAVYLTAGIARVLWRYRIARKIMRGAAHDA